MLLYLFTDQYIPFNLHTELYYQIKVALNTSRSSRSANSDPEVRIELPFDSLLFVGGLQQEGTLLRTQRGRNIYGLRQYSDIEHIIGKRWYVRVLNQQMDFCYVKLDTVQFYLNSRRPLPDYQPGSSVQIVSGGWVLVFRFVRGDGVK